MINLLTVIFLLLLAYYLYFLVRIITGLGNLALTVTDSIYDGFISVIIPFRNESAKILKSIASIGNLDYPEEKFEVIYVDDNSTDDSFTLTEAEIKKNNFKVIRLPDEISAKGNKKRAIKFGIENSRGDVIVTTDADCIHHKNWLKNLAACFDPDTAFVSAPVEFSGSSNFFRRIQKTEFKGLILAGAGLIGAGKPTICNGANIAYRKSAFLRAGGLNDHIDLASGDDGFLMRKISELSGSKVKFCASKEAVVYTESNDSLKSFYNQRKRWASKIIYYENKSLLFNLILIFLFYFGLILQLFFVFAGYSLFLITLVVSLIFKITLELLIMNKGERMFSTKSGFHIFMLTELLQIPYIVITSIAGLFGNFTWKGRKIKR